MPVYKNIKYIYMYITYDTELSLKKKIIYIYKLEYIILRNRKPITL